MIYETKIACLASVVFRPTVKMRVNRTGVLGIGGAAFVALALWMVVEFSPGRQLERAFSRLITAAENRDWKKVKSLMSEDYRDQWGLQRDKAVSLAAEAFQQFLALEIRVESQKVIREGRKGEVEARLRVDGRATAVGEMVMQRANSLENDFQFAWRQKSWKPWDWKLVSVNQNEIEIDPTWIP